MDEYIGETEEGRTKLRDRVRVSLTHLGTTVPTIKSWMTFKSMW